MASLYALSIVSVPANAHIIISRVDFGKWKLVMMASGTAKLYPGSMNMPVHPLNGITLLPSSPAAAVSSLYTHLAGLSSMLRLRNQARQSHSLHQEQSSEAAPPVTLLTSNCIVQKVVCKVERRLGITKHVEQLVGHARRDMF